MSIQGPKGTRDFYPEDMAFQQFIFDKWHKSCRLYGFEQYEGPMFEHLDLYTQKSGDEIEKQLYSFEDKGGRMIALRPELTPTLARMAAARGTNLKRPVRWYSICRLFRYERMQKGRLREFIQLNMDILGVEDVSADAELIAAAIDMMRAFGFDDTDFKARVSSRTLLEELFLLCGVERGSLKALYALLDKKGKLPGDDFSRELESIVSTGDTRAKINDLFNCKSLDEIEKFADSLGSPSTQIASLDQLKRLFGLIDSYGLKDYAVFDIGIVRGLAYYTGTVFELFDVRGSLRAIAGGGRYDNLVGLYGGPPTPAVGFAAGDVVLGELLKSKNLLPPPPPRSDVFLISLDPGAPIIQTGQQLRSAGISCEFPLKSGLNVGKQLKLADNAGAKYALFIGGNEGRNGQARLKNLSDGKEELVGTGNIVGVLREIV
ncbi:MAG: histidine--tRNA ligase [Chitinispirillia bacterium]|nr:histidine--tRNA ligase [Chitinispirillia bacterium]MCL2242685.1 histidine--tRNA ligase [Chitinispirillia bacterium]